MRSWQTMANIPWKKNLALQGEKEFFSLCLYDPKEKQFLPQVSLLSLSPGYTKTKVCD